jgi:type IV pilus assembly protein PilY1
MLRVVALKPEANIMSGFNQETLRMKIKTRKRYIASFLFLVLCASGAGRAEDIDIFAGTSASDPSLPNVIFVLDNTSNWSRQSQKWPGGLTQGQSEVRAIKTAFANLDGQLNVGIVEYNTGGSSSENNAGFVRFDLQTLNEASHAVFDAHLDTIFDNINSPVEKRSSSNPYGDLPWDFYNYLSGIDHSNAGTGTPASIADSDAYTSTYDLFESPLGNLDVCADTYLIFIGNNANGSIASDDSTNSNALRAAYALAGKSLSDAVAGDSSGDPLKVWDFETEERFIEEQIIPGVCAPDTVLEEGYFEQICEDQEVITVVPEQTQSSQDCWKTSEQAACTADENASGFCVGEDDCGCTDLANSHPGCKTTGKPTNRTYRWDVVIPEYEEIEIIPGVCVDGDWVPPGTVIPGECEPDTVSPAETVEIFVPGDGFDDSSGLAYNFDDWAKFLYNVGIPYSATVEGELLSENVRVSTYVIDVFNKQQNEDLSKVWFTAANAGGGRYFQTKNEDEIVTALNSIVGDIIAKESSFAAVSLPLSTTNRARVDNQLYIGMFRPSLGKEPRWFGNLKRYQLALFNSIPRVADVNSEEAINSASGFPKPCAQSFWTDDSDTYWENLGIDPPVDGECADPDVTESVWSDLPDGYFVEKGGAGQQVRALESASMRNLLTVSDESTLRSLGAGDEATMGGQSVYDYFIGDETGTDEAAPVSGLRASIHGDVVHSSPLAFRHGSDSVTVYYGTNSGDYRAVNGADGTERWSLVAPEHFEKIERLYENYPLVEYTGAEEEQGFQHDPKDYFFDGSTGLIAGYDGDNALSYAYIFPTMRRGGRMVYALDVTDPDENPELLWRVGCEELDADTSCTSGFSGIGQTWSKPIGGFVAGYTNGEDEPQLVLAFGGGFDDCLNADVADYPDAGCNAAKGTGVYILDAITGELLTLLETDAPVITDVVPIDINFDDRIDFLYVADVGGSVYRINFVTMSQADPESGIGALAKEDWSIEKIAYTDTSSLRFYNAPAAGALQGQIVVAIGSGDRERPLEVNYPYASNVQNRFYLLIDEPYKTIVDSNETLEVGETYVVDLDGDTMFAVVANPVATFAPLSDDGWYMDLTDRGEQVANPAVIGGGKVFFNSFQPGGVSEGICSEPLGIGTSYEMNLFEPEFTAGVVIDSPGLPIPPVLVTVTIHEGKLACDGEDCGEVSDDCSVPGACRTVTLCIGCNGFEPVEVVPNAPPIRQRVYFTEDIDRDGTQQ